MNNNPPSMLHRYATDPSVTAFSTTRHGGVSTGCHASLNVNPYCGDDGACVSENRRRLCAALGIAGDRLIMPHQTHGIESRIIGKEFMQLPQGVRTMILDGVDAVMTNERGLCIGVSTADCIPLLMHDIRHGAVCAVHAGWRGTVAGMAMKAVTDMKAAFGTRPTDLHVTIGPGISLKNFEVGDEVYNMFAEAGFNMDAISERHEKWHINLPLCNKLALTAAGVPDSQIETCGICTYDNNEDFFSARRMGTASGRIFNGIMLNP